MAHRRAYSTPDGPSLGSGAAVAPGGGRGRTLLGPRSHPAGADGAAGAPGALGNRGRSRCRGSGGAGGVHGGYVGGGEA